jgi:hypothetical protein
MASFVVRHDSQLDFIVKGFFWMYECHFKIYEPFVELLRLWCYWYTCQSQKFGAMQ